MCFSPDLGVRRGKGLWHNLLMQFPTFGSSKMGISETFFFIFSIIYNDKISDVKHVVDPLHVFSTLFGCWTGAEAASKGMGHNVLILFSTHRTSKMEIVETHFFYILTLHNDQLCYVNNVCCFRPSLSVFRPIWVLDGDFVTN